MNKGDNLSLKIGILGAGYVGFSNAIFLSQHHNILIIEIDSDKVDKINRRISPIKDDSISSFLAQNPDLKFKAQLSSENIPKDIDLFILALPTNFDNNKNRFDTSILESQISLIHKLFNKTPILIRSTVPIGFSDQINSSLKTNLIYFSPEFLREGLSLNDCMNPSRIIIGGKGPHRKFISDLYKDLSRNDPKVSFMSNTEAESVKLFSNTFLAMRVAFFNELDTFSLRNNLNSFNIIDGVSSDDRIGNYYNNPSFGFGGYCLPKDTKQLNSDFKDTPHALIQAINHSNSQRTQFLSKCIIEKQKYPLGIYRLNMKHDSDNIRNSASIELMLELKKASIGRIVLYEPLIKDKIFMGVEVLNNIEEFFSISRMILANRLDPELDKFPNDIFTRDIFKEN